MLELNHARPRNRRPTTASPQLSMDEAVRLAALPCVQGHEAVE